MHTLSCNTLHTLSWNTLNTLSYPFVLSTIQRYRNLSVMTHRAFVPLRFLLHSGSSEQLMMWNVSIWKSCSWQWFNRGVELRPHVRTQVLSCSYMRFYWRRNPWCSSSSSHVIHHVFWCSLANYFVLVECQMFCGFCAQRLLGDFVLGRLTPRTAKSFFAPAKSTYALLHEVHAPAKSTLFGFRICFWCLLANYFVLLERQMFFWLLCSTTSRWFCARTAYAPRR